MLSDFAEASSWPGSRPRSIFGAWQVPFLFRDGFHFPGGRPLALPHLAGRRCSRSSSFTVKVFLLCVLPDPGALDLAALTATTR